MGPAAISSDPGLFSRQPGPRQAGCDKSAGFPCHIARSCAFRGRQGTSPSQLRRHPRPSGRQSAGSTALLGQVPRYKPR